MDGIVIFTREQSLHLFYFTFLVKQFHIECGGKAVTKFTFGLTPSVH